MPPNVRPASLRGWRWALTRQLGWPPACSRCARPRYFLGAAPGGVAAFFPVSPSSSGFESSRTANSIGNSATWPASWRAAGVSPRDTSLYCTYMTNAGGAGQAVPGAATFGAKLVTGTAAPWFYGLAACNMSGAAGFPSSVTVMGISSSSPTLRTFNEGQ